MEQLALVVLNGMSMGMSVFLTAAGLTLVFGILHVLNFAHGGFLMIGSYIAYSALNRWETPSLMIFVAVVLLCGVSLAILGMIVDRVVLYRLRAAPDDYTLIATYALLLFCDGIVKKIWGPNFLSVGTPTELAGATVIGGVTTPTYVLFLIGSSVLIFLLLDHAIHRTDLGKRVQAVALDPWMSGVLGINVGAVRTAVVIVGFALAGIAGGILSLNQSLDPSMGGTLIIQAFGVIIVGGMGSIRGAFVAAIALGLLTAFGDRMFPQIPSLFFYVAMVAMLLIRPQGLFRGLR